MSMELTKRELKRALATPAYQTVTEPSNMVRFDAKELAHILDLQVTQCERKGLSHITITLGLVDAKALAKALRRAMLTEA